MIVGKLSSNGYMARYQYWLHYTWLTSMTRNCRLRTNQIRGYIGLGNRHTSTRTGSEHPTKDTDRQHIISLTIANQFCWIFYGSWDAAQGTSMGPMEKICVLDAKKRRILSKSTFSSCYQKSRTPRPGGHNIFLYPSFSLKFPALY